MRARFGTFMLDTEERQLLTGGQPVPLTPKAFALLEYLVECRPRAVAKSHILEQVWPTTFVSEANIASLVKEIRRALGDDAAAPRFVRSVRGFGYAFVAEVVTENEPDGPGSPVRDAVRTEFRIQWNRREMALSPGENVLGRTREAAVWVDHSSVSRRHAVIRISGETATLEDCDSKNGTFLHGRRVKKKERLAPDAEIRLGRARLVFRAYPLIGSTATASREG